MYNVLYMLIAKHSGEINRQSLSGYGQTTLNPPMMNFEVARSRVICVGSKFSLFKKMFPINTIPLFNG